MKIIQLLYHILCFNYWLIFAILASGFILVFIILYFTLALSRFTIGSKQLYPSFLLILHAILVCWIMISFTDGPNSRPTQLRLFPDWQTSLNLFEVCVNHLQLTIYAHEILFTRLINFYKAFSILQLKIALITLQLPESLEHYQFILRYKFNK